MRLKITKLYEFDELSAKAKENARDWFRSTDEFDADAVLEDAATIAELLGIQLKIKDGKPCILFTGFSAQGDGACFEGTYRYKSDAVQAVKDHAPTDTVLHRIAEELEAIQKRYDYQVVLQVTHTAHYYHSRSVDYEEIGEPEMSAEDRKAMEECLRKFMDWIYEQLRDEYEGQQSDDSVDEGIRGNDYEFTGAGKRSTDPETDLPTVKAKECGQVTVKDPDTGLDVDVSFLKLETGGMIGVDSSFLANTDEPIYSPFDAGVELVLDEPERTS